MYDFPIRNAESLGPEDVLAIDQGDGDRGGAGLFHGILDGAASCGNGRLVGRILAAIAPVIAAAGRERKERGEKKSES